MKKLRQVIAYFNCAFGTMNLIAYIHAGVTSNLVVGILGLVIGFSTLGQLAKDDQTKDQ